MHLSIRQSSEGHNSRLMTSFIKSSPLRPVAPGLQKWSESNFKPSHLTLYFLLSSSHLGRKQGYGALSVFLTSSFLFLSLSLLNTWLTLVWLAVKTSSPLLELFTPPLLSPALLLVSPASGSVWRVLCAANWAAWAAIRSVHLFWFLLFSR